jgi:isoleucyl-tRNA synthetase
MEQYGADIIRLWALSVDYTEDHRIGDEIIRGISDRYRKLRNTFRYLLGALGDYAEDEAVAPDAMPELERWVLHRLAELDGELRRAAEDYDYTAYVTALETFAVRDLSSFYFDVRKDSLYCDAADDPRRRSCRTVLDILFHALVRWSAPILAFTAEEVWLTRYPSADGSVHLSDWPEIDAGWADEALGAKWARLRRIRAAVTEAIEPLRREKTIRSSNEADVALVLSDREALGDVESVDFAELAIVSRVDAGADAIGGAEQSETYEGAWVRIDRTELEKCARCWRHTPDVDTASALCKRCREVVPA